MDQLQLAPPNELSEPERQIAREQIERARQLIEQASVEQAATRFRFSVGELFGLTTLAAIGLAGAKWLPPGVFAGIAGLAAMCSLIIFASHLKSRGIQIVQCGLLIIYSFATVSTLLRQIF